ncbi:MAG: DUF4365 domain-containing protein [Caldilineaceae bacterium]
MKLAEGLLEERAEQLAIVHLTRRDDLHVVVTGARYDDGIDLLVHITQNGVKTGRIWGVQVVARKALSFVGNGSSTSYKVNMAMPSVSTFSDLPFPLCQFVFSMENDEGYYRWLLEPVVESSIYSKLLLNEQNSFRRLTKAELDNIVQLVNDWYATRSSI